jgi:probable rRNA maturation factor
VSPPGRPKGEPFARQREGNRTSSPGRRKDEAFAHQRKASWPRSSGAGDRRSPRAAGAARRRSPPAPPLALRLQIATMAAGLPAAATLRRWVRRALEHPAAITLRLVGAAEGRRLNRDYRGRDYATNVLAFVYRGPPRIEADIVLCLPVLRREARAAGRSLRAHLAHLVIHGVLHAQGYTHERTRDTARMQEREAGLLDGLRIADPYR